MKQDAIKIMQDEMTEACNQYKNLFNNYKLSITFKEYYTAKKGYGAVSTLKLKKIDDAIQVFVNNADHKCYFRISAEQLKELKEWLNANS